MANKTRRESWIVTRPVKVMTPNLSGLISCHMQQGWFKLTIYSKPHIRRVRRTHKPRKYARPCENFGTEKCMLSSLLFVRIMASVNVSSFLVKIITSFPMRIDPLCTHTHTPTQTYIHRANKAHSKPMCCNHKGLTGHNYDGAY